MFDVPERRAVRRIAAVAMTMVLVAACGNTDTGQDAPLTAALITKTTTNPFFVTLQHGAEKRASEKGIRLTVSSGKQDGDVASQIAAINAAIARKDRAILIAPNGQAVDPALKRARDAGIFVVALDTKPADAGAADITFATDNFEAGRLIGAWSAKKMRGQPAVIAMLDLFGNRGVESDTGRNQGFLTGMGIPVGDPDVKGDEAVTGDYSGSTYRIACRESTFGAEDEGRTAMQRCLAANPAINLVYTINEPAASGAAEALQAAANDATLVSVDGGCDPGMKLVAAGVIDATAQQYPLAMAEQGIDAVADWLEDETRPTPNHGIDMVATGVKLVTDEPQPDVPSISVAQGLKECWGKAD